MSSTHRPDAGRARLTMSLSCGLLAGLMTLALALAAPISRAAGIVDIANVPLGTSLITAKPNVMFILDDSGSMAWNAMPDDLVDFGVNPIGCNPNTVGCRTSQCNGVAYNPGLLVPGKVDATGKNPTGYQLPLKATGLPFDKATFASAKDDGFATNPTTTNLTNQIYYRYTSSQPALSWSYNPDGSLISNTFTNECFASTANPVKVNGVNVVAGVFEEVPLSTASAERQQDYANWWSYYRKRYLTMRSAVSQSFATLDANYRVGFTVISDTGIGASFLNVGDFDNKQKDSFYSQLFTSSPNLNGTPLRGALSKVGRYYGNKLVDPSTGKKPPDPAEFTFTNPVTNVTSTSKFECQRNYALLSTDGYWNNDSNQLSSTYRTGFKLDSDVPVGEQDGREARPMRDGTGTMKDRITKVTRVDAIRIDTTLSSVTQPMRRTASQLLSNNKSCKAPSFLYQQQVQTGNLVTAQVSRAYFDQTFESTITTPIVNGTPQTPTQSAFVEVSRTPTKPTESLVLTTAPTWSPAISGKSATVCLATKLTSLFNPSDLGATNGLATTNNTPSTGQPVTVTPGTAVPGTPVDSPEQSTNGDSNTLADIARYYWYGGDWDDPNHDLRPDISNNVKALKNDPATWQHMTTYTIGMGVRGSLIYDPNYLLNNPPTGDYGKLFDGTKSWPIPSGTVNSWASDATHVDDLWHAAVNGRGQYFSASNATDLSNAITSSLRDVTAALGTAAAAASSTLTPSASDDWLFLTRYNSAPTWNGDLLAFKFTFNADGTLKQPDTTAGNEEWGVQGKLDKGVITPLARTVWFNKGGTRADFTYTNLSVDQKAYFDNRCTTTLPKLTQCDTLTANALAKATGDNMVAFIAGNNGLLLNNDVPDSRVWRARKHRLGDIVHASPVFVAKPSFGYSDAGYSAFAAAKANRTKVVYLGANDGMLHAFKVADKADSTAGDELWAFVPSAVISNLWTLADSGYDNNHRYFVDATVNVGDVYDSVNKIWRTILVGGLGGGGRGYFALDVTDPTTPSLLWEFTDNNLGLTFGNPVIAKNKAGVWTVAFASGYNNINPGDGIGRLFVLNAVTGALIQTVATTAGDGTTPSNLARINAWVLKDTDNTALRYYGGDMQGNMWRFDPDDIVAPSGVEAALLGQATGPNGTPQPITSRPLLTEIAVDAGQAALISFGTGRYLGTGDLTNADVQSIYTVKDSLLATGLGVLRDPTAKLVKLEIVEVTVAGKPVRKPKSTPMIDWTVDNGWYVDLTVSQRERVYLDATPVGSGVIAFASIIPNGDPCSSGGTSWLYEFGIKAGKLIQATFYKSPIVGDGRVVDSAGPRTLITTQDGVGDPSDRIPVDTVAGSPVKRTSWRELQD